MRHWNRPDEISFKSMIVFYLRAEKGLKVALNDKGNVDFFLASTYSWPGYSDSVGEYPLLKRAVNVSHSFRGLPWCSDGKVSAYNAEDRFDTWVGKILWRKQWQPTPVLVPGKSHGRSSLVGYSLWGHKESDTTKRLHFHDSIRK